MRCPREGTVAVAGLMRLRGELSKEPDCTQAGPSEGQSGTHRNGLRRVRGCGVLGLKYEDLRLG